MLFWLLIICLIACCIGFIKSSEYSHDGLAFVFLMGIVSFSIFNGISFVIAFDSHICVDAYIASCNERHDALVYQLENNLYDNDNDLGKKELYNEIKEWNEDLAFRQAVQDDFWLGIYYPNIYDQFEFIEYE